MADTLAVGKLDMEFLAALLEQYTRIDDERVVVGPRVGEDALVIEFGDHFLVAKTDPITFATDEIGWYAVNVNANDIATFGVDPLFLFSCIMLPENGAKETVEAICTQMDAAAKELGIAIVGGHCESTPGLKNPIVVGCVMGLTEKGDYVTAGGAQAGDKLILTKSAGIEGTAILASDREQQLASIMGSSMLADAKNFYRQISVVKDALTAYKTGGVHAMHDPTEGGVAGGIHEMSDASQLGVKIFEEKIGVEPETAKICRYFEIDPFQLIGSGALLISAEPEKATAILDNLAKAHLYAAVIGEFHGNVNKRLLVKADGNVQDLPRPVSDHLWAALAH